MFGDKWEVCGCKFSHGTLNERLMSLMYLRNHPEISTLVEWREKHEGEVGCGCLQNPGGADDCVLVHFEEPVHLHEVRRLVDSV